MSWNVVSKNNSNLSGTTSNRTKITGDENTLDVKAKQDLWISGNDNDGKVSFRDQGRLAVDGSHNNFSLVDASGNTIDRYNDSLEMNVRSNTLIRGSNNKISSYTGSNGNDVVSLRGTNNLLYNAVFKGGKDRLTSNNGTIGSADMGSGNDFVGIKDAQDKFTLNGGAGTDKLWLDKIDDNVDGSSISNFEQLYLKDYNSDYKVTKGADGKYTLSNGNNKLALGSNDIEIWDGTKYTKASVLAGATGSTGSTGATGITGTNGDDLIDDDKLKGDLSGATVDGKAGDDKFFVDPSLTNATLKGGQGTDTLGIGAAFNDYDISFDNGQYTFKNGSKSFKVNDDFEKFNFDDKTFNSSQELKDFIKPFTTTANADTLDLAGAASKYKKNVTFLGGDDVAILKNDATGYTLDGGDGTGDLLKLSGFTFANLKAQTNWNGSGNGISGLNINGNAISNFEKFDATGLTNTAATPTAGSLFTKLEDFIAWLTAV